METRNSLLRKLVNSKWGADPKTVRTTALGLCLSAAEYASSAWSRSCHARKVDPVINDTCRIVTGCLKTTPVPCLYALAGIAPPDIRRKVHDHNQRRKQVSDDRHPLHHHQSTRKRLSSRSSFMDCTQPLTTSVNAAINEEWISRWNENSMSTTWVSRGIVPSQELATGNGLRWPVWKTLNRLRVQQGRSKHLLKTWKIISTDMCDCGTQQTMKHLLSCSQAPNCSFDDLAEPTDTAVACAAYWSSQI